MFGEKLYQLRKLYNLSQRDLAKKLNLSQTAIGKYERNEAEADFTTLKALSKLFNVTIDYLLDNDPTNKSISVDEIKSKIQKLDREQLLDIVEKQIDLITLIKK